MSDKLLLDTGALISLLDRSQAQHAECAGYFSAWTGEVITTEAVITEATHLLGRVPGGATACLDFILAGGALVVPSSLDSLRRARNLMDQYADRPMDFADATLVVLAEDLGNDLIMTTDRADFAIYRINGKRAFRVVP